MKHLLICREFPPAPAGGIGVYAAQIARELASRGETVHVIGQLWEKAAPLTERACDGRLIVHRVPYEDGASLRPRRPHPALRDEIARDLFHSVYPPQGFAWQAALLAEHLIDGERIDVVEASEFEAPLYYLQLRRALGLGPARRPPCIVQLHSPTEFIARHNNWDLSRAPVSTAIEQERYSITAAEGLICPSRFLARQAEAHYGLAPGTVHVIPYPLGADGEFPQDHRTVQETVCFVGRLEPRKGVYEWVDAAVAIAPRFPHARFDFVGGDTVDDDRSVRTVLESRIPRTMRVRFRFHGERTRSDVARRLAEARLAVVPSRWDNFPYACMEAMAAGTPVLATRQGGMAEMVTEGETGWLAPSVAPDALAETLRRALSTPLDRTREMGRRAAADIRRLCDPDRVVDAHRTWRRLLVGRDPRTLPLPQPGPVGAALFDGTDWIVPATGTARGGSSRDDWQTGWSHLRLILEHPGSTARQIRARLRNKLLRRVGQLRRWSLQESR